MRLWRSIRRPVDMSPAFLQPCPWESSSSRTPPMRGSMFSVVTSIACRSALRAKFENGCKRWQCPIGRLFARASHITLEEFLKNRQRLEKNRTHGGKTVLGGAAREGLALLQGLLLCGHCGRALTVRYSGNGGVYPRICATGHEGKTVGSKTQTAGQTTRLQTCPHRT
jgi:hypothetical protein